jgi:hypothetical protein
MPNVHPSGSGTRLWIGSGLRSILRNSAASVQRAGFLRASLGIVNQQKLRQAAEPAAAAFKLTLTAPANILIVPHCA